jgi:diguanylate cyclase (GGDEF)-like protein
MPGVGRGPLLSAVLVAGALAAGVLLGDRVGPLALLLCVPGGIVAAYARSLRQERERRLEALSRQDPLTGLGNARLLRERLGYELARHARHDRPLAVVVLDLDGFKGVNDRFGHAAGDEVLRDVAAALERTVRDQDTVVRQGGDEFCVLAPESGAEEADRLVERLQQAVADSVSGLSGLSGSFGAAVYPQDGRSAAELLERADAVAGEAKRRSRRQRPRLRRSHAA